MEYERIEIDPGMFKDILPEGAKLYKRPELPRLEFKMDNTSYYVTDLRLLSEPGVETFLMILDAVISQPEITEVSFRIVDSREDEIQKIIDIVSGIDYGYKRGRGKTRSEFNGTFLVTGCYTSEDSLSFEIIPSEARTIYEYAKDKQGKISLFELVIALCDANDKAMDDYIRKES